MAKPKGQQPVLTGMVRVGDPIPEGVNILWSPHPGPQSEALIRTEDEILYGGAKGGGKTACGIIWLIKGNPVSCPSCHADVAYINHPHYRALVLRKNLNDMGDWIDKAKRIYFAMGATFEERPIPLFKFPSGAKIVLGHLDDKDAYSKYTGQEFQRFLLEEATLVPDMKSFLMVRSCIRSVYKELRAQVFLTSNPGGPGHSWVRDRYVRPKDETGNWVRPLTTISEKIGPYTRTRVYVPAKVSDNPTLMADPTYMGNLMSLPEAERRAYLDGDWDALSGIYFTEFRPTGPLGGEPQEARHVVTSHPIKPWMPRSIGMDWGYAHEGAVYWGAENDDGRFHVYRELVRKGLGAEMWGVEIALASLEDLKGMGDGAHMNLWLSPDAWDKRNDVRTVADQIRDGILKVLGPDSVLLLSADEMSEEDFFERLDSQRRMGITIRKAANQRVSGAQYIRSLLRWWPLTKVEQDSFNEELYIRLMHKDARKAIEYREAYSEQRRERLPGLLIHDCCPRLIQVMQSMVYDETKPEDVMKIEGDDAYDAFRYLAFARTKLKAREPFQVFAERRVAQIQATHGGEMDGNTLVWVMRKAEQDYAGMDDMHTAPVNFPRLSGRRAKEMVQ